MRRYADLALALLALAWVLLHVVRWVSQPYVPFVVDVGGRVAETRTGSVVGTGDRLLLLNGRRLEGAGDFGAAVREAGRGVPLRLVFERDGERREAVQPRAVRPANVFITRLAGSLLAVIFLGIGVLVRLRPTGWPGRLFFSFCVATAVVLGSTTRSTGLFVHVVTAAELFGPAFLLHFFLLFPHRHPLLRRFPWLTSLLYVPPAAFLIVLLGLSLASRIWIVPSVLADTLGRGSALFVVAYFLWAVLTFADSYRRLEDPLEKEKLRWLLWGVVVSIVPVMVLLGLEILFDVELPYADVASLILLLFLPVSFGYAILSHRLMDIEIVINRGLVYSAITVILVVLFIVVENVLAALSLELTGRSSFALAMGAAAAMAVLVSPVKRRMESFVDQLFFAYKVRLREGLRDLAEELSFITDLERMETLLVRRLAHLAHVGRAALFLREENGEGYLLTEEVGLPGWREATWDGHPSEGGRSARFDANDAFVIWLVRESRPLSLETLAEGELERRLDPAEVVILREADAAVCLPLRLRSDLIGFLLLSRRLNRELFNREELELLHHLAVKAAVDLANARLQTRSRRLEEEVYTLREELLAGLRGFLAGPGGGRRLAPGRLEGARRSVPPPDA